MGSYLQPVKYLAVGMVPDSRFEIGDDDFDDAILIFFLLYVHTKRGATWHVALEKREDIFVDRHHGSVKTMTETDKAPPAPILESVTCHGSRLVIEYLVKCSAAVPT
jgi:hypothetical protein